MKAGVFKRIGTRLPDPNKNTLRKFRTFVRRWVKKNLTPLSPDSDLSFETWLGKTNYTESRKAELRRCMAKNPNIRDPKYHACKCFMKDETYSEYKHARGIFSRTDEWKCFMGPYIKAIEEVVYSLPQFIKHIPVSLRPDYIMNYLFRPGAKFFATDYTSFESSFVEQLMDVCGFELYRFMLCKIPQYREFLFAMRVLSGKNKCYFKNFWFSIFATRMSGEMDTSLANGFTNLMVGLFLCKITGCGTPQIVVEGDDGLATTPTNRYPTPDDYARLGFNIKIETHEQIETASFCGIIFDRNERVNVTNPLETLFTIGWLPERYARARKSVQLAVLRCKAFSAAHQYPGCPMIYEYSQYILRLTRQYHKAAVDIVTKKKGFNTYERDSYLAAINSEGRIPVRPTGMATRQLVEQKFGIPIGQQIEFEEMCRNKQELSPIDGTSLLKYVHPSWIDYYNRYGVETVDRIDYPSLTVFQAGCYKRYSNRTSLFDSIDVDDDELMEKLV